MLRTGMAEGGKVWDNAICNRGSGSLVLVNEGLLKSTEERTQCPGINVPPICQKLHLVEQGEYFPVRLMDGCNDDNVLGSCKMFD